MKDIEEIKSPEELEEFKDVTIQKDQYTEKGHEEIVRNSKKEKPAKAPTKGEKHTILSTEIKNNLLGLIKGNMPKLEEVSPRACTAAITPASITPRSIRCRCSSACWRPRSSS